MNKIKIGQIWEGREPGADWDYTLCFKINNIINDYVHGICTTNTFIPNRMQVGGHYTLDNRYLNDSNWRLKQDAVGKNCATCQVFYNEVKKNNMYNVPKLIGYFICWSCDIK